MFGNILGLLLINPIRPMVRATATTATDGSRRAPPGHRPTPGKSHPPRHQSHKMGAGTDTPLRGDRALWNKATILAGSKRW